MATSLTTPSGRTRAGIVFFLIPAIQRGLGMASRAITHLMARLDLLAFRLAEKVER